MRIVCLQTIRKQTILMKYHILFFSKDVAIFLSAAVVIGLLRVN